MFNKLISALTKRLKNQSTQMRQSILIESLKFKKKRPQPMIFSEQYKKSQKLSQSKNSSPKKFILAKSVPQLKQSLQPLINIQPKDQ